MFFLASGGGMFAVAQGQLGVEMLYGGGTADGAVLYRSWVWGGW